MNTNKMEEFEKIRKWVQIPGTRIYTFITKSWEPGLYRVFLKGEKGGEILFYDKVTLAKARRAVRILREDLQYLRYWEKILNDEPLQQGDSLI